MVDSDIDTRPDFRDLDSDNDGMADVLEAGGVDADLNGIADGTPDANGMPVAPGLVPVNSDTDAIPNYRDIDSDNDGVNDVKENTGTAAYDINNDGRVDGADTDNDGVINSPFTDTNNTYGGIFSVPSDTDNNGTPNYIQKNSTSLNLKVMLQGAMINRADGLMGDNLRTLSLIPFTTPYSSTLGTKFTNVAETTLPTSIALLASNAGTGNAIVDWVFVELRNPAAPTVVVKSFSALVQRDGDVVAPNGQLLSTDLTGSYLVAIKHRTHLGAMMVNPITLDGTTQTIDFTTATSADLYNNAGYDGAEMTTVNGKRALWAGNCNIDNKVKFSGNGTELLKLAESILTHADNTTGAYGFSNAVGYLSGDVNMDGKAKYDGLANDRILIQQIVLGHPLNTGLSNSFNGFLEQLP